MSRIFIIEDDQKIRGELRVFLQRNGFECLVTDHFTQAVTEVMNALPDLVLLDLNLPNIDGYHICKEIRKSSEIPVVVITSQNSDMDELMSISFGADDYITKPFNTQILLARIQNVLRRYQKTSDKLIHKGILLNLSSGIVENGDQRVELTINELRIMHILMAHAGTIVSRDEIMEALWQSNAFVDDNTLTVNINRLRKKLSSIDIEDFLKTKRGQGYIV